MMHGNNFNRGKKFYLYWKNISKIKIDQLTNNNSPENTIESIQEQLETEFTENKFFEDVIINLSKTE
ncbi:hypothetical protein [Enterococcus rivorum]|uniref:Uncharacterized protein n=1 Tax=Enterococcus rivorum TaxID=762845 RepID=A0A1E5KUS1_9ENTE|nr:hypothetical protein [Enterococcus rivorum]OEH81612.1 hypothetical protein BCR26_16190 [Enterococcus rivorum]OEH83967.1 hypothetical protein BCR26_00395 [Enterococcus rivorum]